MSPVLTAESKPDHQAQTLEDAAAAGVNLERLPRHVAIIMDGNGRWARSMRRPRIEGHRAGIKTVREIVRNCRRLEIPYLTLYAFSAENWKRPSAEVNALMFLLCNFLRREIREMKENEIQLQAIGHLHELPGPVQRALEYAIKETAGGSKMRLTLALSYGGRLEIVDAVKATAQKVKDGVLNIDDITPEQFSNELNTAGTPDPDLLIRTSGEMRVSNFLLWQIAYAEIWITQTLWPDFGPKSLFESLKEFQGRQRRFGGVDIDGAL
ncbi:MAG: isoprenyl transferase [Candidatus Hinthialibacter antarcticus]|nr:isoprenyl transferase [Candidatus Hinthialibacter antarcticus]